LAGFVVKKRKLKIKIKSKIKCILGIFNSQNKMTQWQDQFGMNILESSSVG
jgi:hypothetical protein